MSIVAIIQARLGSSRLPGKVMKDIEGNPVIKIVIDRLSNSKLIDKIVVATSNESKDDPLAEYLKELGISIFRGSENNVLSRYYEASIKYKASSIVRITADCPIIDPNIVDMVIQKFLDKEADYCSNIFPRSYPQGLDTEIFTKAALKKTYLEAKTYYDKEHVTPYIRNSEKFKVINLLNDKDASNHRWTLDYEEDLRLLKIIFKYFNPEIHFSSQQVMDFILENPEIISINKQYRIK